MRFSGGGGVVAEFFRDLEKPMRFSGGGGGCSRNFLFRDLKTSFSVNGALFFLLSRRGARAPWAPPESATDYGVRKVVSSNPDRANIVG